MSLTLEVEFKKLLAILVTRNAENSELTDEQFLLNMREVEAILSALCDQYQNQLNELSALDQGVIKEILIILIKELMRFDQAGLYSHEQLEEALDYLIDVPAPAHCCCHDSLKLDNANRIRAFLNRLFRPVNQLISAFINSAHLKNELDKVSTVFLYLAWIFPSMRLLCRFEKIIQHSAGLIGISEDEKRLPACVRFRAQINVVDIVRDFIQTMIRLLGCFIFSSYTTHVTFVLFTIRFIESIFWYVSGQPSVDSGLALYVNQQRETERSVIPISFFGYALKHKESKMKKNNTSKLVISLGYELGMVISLLGVVDIGLNKNAAGGVSILGAVMIALICLVETADNFSKSSAIFRVKKHQLDRVDEFVVPLVV